MKITAIRTLSLSRAHEPERQWQSATFHVPKADCSICIIETDEGLQGIAEPCAYGVPPDIAARIEQLKPGLIGRAPCDEDLIPANEAVRANDIANAGLNCALWDLRGKIANKTTAELLVAEGQQPLRRLRLYASSGVGYDWDDHPESVVEEAIGYAEEGLTAYKMRLGTHWAWSNVTVDRFLTLARQVHEAVGDRMDLALDGNCRLSVEEALPIAEALEDMGWAWFEEPVERLPADYARLNEAVSIPVTGGEPFTTWAQFEPFMAVGAFGVVQPDAGVCGIDFCMQVGRKAHADYGGIPLIPHNWHNGLMTMANAHMVAALPGIDGRESLPGEAASGMLELNMRQGPLQWEILREKPAIEDGYLILPDAPGLGVELADDIETRFPYIEGPWGTPIQR